MPSPDILLSGCGRLSFRCSLSALKVLYRVSIDNRSHTKTPGMRSTRVAFLQMGRRHAGIPPPSVDLNRCRITWESAGSLEGPFGSCESVRGDGGDDSARLGEPNQDFSRRKSVHMSEPTLHDLPVSHIASPARRPPRFAARASASASPSGPSPAASAATGIENMMQAPVVGES